MLFKFSEHILEFYSVGGISYNNFFNTINVQRLYNFLFILVHENFIFSMEICTTSVEIGNTAYYCPLTRGVYVTTPSLHEIFR